MMYVLLFLCAFALAEQTTNYPTDDNLNEDVNKELSDYLIKFGYLPPQNSKSSDSQIVNKYVMKQVAKTPQCPFALNTTFLGHDYYPDAYVDNVEIHIYNLVEWVPNQKTDLLYVLAHEIGHAIEISYIEKQDALMFAIMMDASNVKLIKDDISAVQNLYGKNPQTSKSITTTTTADNFKNVKPRILTKEPTPSL